MLKKGLIYLILSLQPYAALSFSMNPQGLDAAIRKYLSIYNNYKIDENIDEDVVNDFVKLIWQNSNLFHHIAKLETDPEFSPYIEKYSNLKMQFLGYPIDANVKVVFSYSSLKDTNHNKDARNSGTCDYFTRVVFLDRGYWNHHKDNEKLREDVLFHELGHCDLYRKHVLHNSDKYLSSFMSSLASLLMLPTPIDLNKTWYAKDPVKIKEILKLRENLDDLFEILYEELFSEQNTKDNLSCDPRFEEFKRQCIISQREALDRYKLNLPAIRQLVGHPI